MNNVEWFFLQSRKAALSKSHRAAALFDCFILNCLWQGKMGRKKEDKV